MNVQCLVHDCIANKNCFSLILRHSKYCNTWCLCVRLIFKRNNDINVKNQINKWIWKCITFKVLNVRISSSLIFSHGYILYFIYSFIHLISHWTNIVPTIGGIKPRKMIVGCATTVLKMGKWDNTLNWTDSRWSSQKTFSQDIFYLNWMLKEMKLPHQEWGKYSSTEKHR